MKRTSILGNEQTLWLEARSFVVGEKLFAIVALLGLRNSAKVGGGRRVDEG
jgi:hypothetical protein